jgi:hypothetical protein
MPGVTMEESIGRDMSGGDTPDGIKGGNDARKALQSGAAQGTGEGKESGKKRGKGMRADTF